MPLISHRGAAHLASANSKSAILTGDDYSPAYIEIDINCTSDNVLVIHHGAVSRFLQGKKTKESYKELKEKFPGLLTWAEFLKIKTQSPFLFDIKVSGKDILPAIIDGITRSQLTDFAFTSPHESALIAMKSAFPDSFILQTQPYHHGPVSALELARKNGFSGVMLNKWWLTPLIYNLCRLHKKQIGAYTIDSALVMWHAQRLYPGLYIVTNRPDIYRKLFPLTESTKQNR